MNFHRPTRRLVFRICALLLGLGAFLAGGQQVAREYELKAVFLYRFTQFVEWPASAFPSPESPLIIGILGQDPFGGYLPETVRGERVHGRQLIVQHYQRSQEARDCQVLFISTSEEAHLEETFTALKGRSILTVGESGDFARRGGMIQFITEQNHIRFRINLRAARTAHLQISSKLLELAEVVNAPRE